MRKTWTIVAACVCCVIYAPVSGAMPEFCFVRPPVDMSTWRDSNGNIVTQAFVRTNSSGVVVWRVDSGGVGTYLHTTLCGLTHIGRYPNLAEDRQLVARLFTEPGFPALVESKSTILAEESDKIFATFTVTRQVPTAELQKVVPVAKGRVFEVESVIHNVITTHDLYWWSEELRMPVYIYSKDSSRVITSLVSYTSWPDSGVPEERSDDGAVAIN